MSDAAAPNDAQADYWEQRSSSWIAAEGFTSRVGGPFGQRAIDHLAPRSGWSVLDVGCGTGPTSVHLAGRVNPGGRVLGVDISPSMIERARARAEAEGVTDVTFEVADAQTADLGRAVHDAVFSQFGVMFFADPVGAFANLRRCLRDGGRLCFVCWQDLSANEWMFVPGAAALGVTGVLPPMPAPGEPGPFSLADPDRIHQVLSAAGFDAVEVTSENHTLRLPADELDAAVESSTQVGAVREALEGQDDPEVRERIRQAVHDALDERVEDGEVRLSAAAHLVTARAGITSFG